MAYSTNVLIESCSQTADAIKNLSVYKSSMQLAALSALERFTEWWEKTKSLNVRGFDGVMAYTTVLASFRSEFDHLFMEHDSIIRSRVTRAFLHLQRSLVVDDTLREKWLAAFEDHETACEELGAVHLLSHGVYAFKASATGGRTDLILGQDFVVDDGILAGSDGLVLTEWKRVHKQAEAEANRLAATNQAKLYADGPIAGFELTTERYLVLVSKTEFGVTTVEQDGAILYRTISIILDPDVPSRAARKGREPGKSSST